MTPHATEPTEEDLVTIEEADGLIVVRFPELAPDHDDNPFFARTFTDRDAAEAFADQARATVSVQQPGSYTVPYEAREPSHPYFAEGIINVITEHLELVHGGWSSIGHPAVDETTGGLSSTGSISWGQPLRIAAAGQSGHKDQPVHEDVLTTCLRVLQGQKVNLADLNHARDALASHPASATPSGDS